MKAGPELAGWLSDDDRQANARAQADAIASKWLGQPICTSLKAELSAMEERTAFGVLAAAERFMDGLSAFEDMMNEIISHAAANPYFMPPLATSVTEINTGFLLFADPDLTIGLGIVSADALAAKRTSVSGTTAIPFTGLLTRYRFLKSGGAVLSLWEAPLIDGDFTGGKAGRCRPTGRIEIADGEGLVLDGRYQSFVVDHLASDMLCLQATIWVGAAPLTVNYDSRTFRYLGATSTDEVSSRTQMMVSLLRLMERTDAMPVIEQLLESPHFYTRWHVMREMLALDAEAALPALRRMARHDPHPEVRFAAVQTLDLFFNDQQEEARLCRA